MISCFASAREGGETVHCSVANQILNMGLGTTTPRPGHSQGGPELDSLPVKPADTSKSKFKLNIQTNVRHLERKNWTVGEGLKRSVKILRTNRYLNNDRINMEKQWKLRSCPRNLFNVPEVNGFIQKLLSQL